MSHLDHVADRVLNQPLLILPSKLGVIAQILSGRIGLDASLPELGVEPVGRPEPLASRFVGSRTDDSGRRGALPYARTAGGTGIVTVTGSLVNRGAWIGANSGLTSYEGIAHQLRSAAADDQVSALALDLATPGGEAVGAFELAELVRTIAAEKPVTAFVNGLAASAGYLIASGATRIVSIPSGLTGSIGVVMMHADYSRALANAGITPTFIFSGDRKVDGNAFEPLSADVKARLKAEVDTMREAFVQAVATGRGRRMSAKAARDTEAAVYGAAEARDVGLVDEVASFDAVLGEIDRKAARGGNRGAARAGGKSMEFTQADIDGARAAGREAGFAAGRAEGHAAGLEEGRKAGITAGAEAERARIKAIVEHPEAKGREALAAHYAYATADTPEAAGNGLKAAAKAAGGLEARAGETERGFHASGDNGRRAAPVIDAADIYARLNAAVPGA